MITGVEMRWLIRCKSVTAMQVSTYSRENGVTMNDAKGILQNKRGPVLQYRQGSGCDWSEWKDVPTEVIEE